MKTLFWTGSYCGSPHHGQAAIWRWWNYYRQHQGALGITHFAVFNDGPNNLPVEFFVERQNMEEKIKPLRTNWLNLFYWPSHLGFKGVHDRKGFWRNLLGAIQVSREQEFERFILVEFDCMILSAEMLYEVGGTKSGRVCYWCPTYSMPETSVVICGMDAMERLEQQAKAILEKKEPSEADRFETAIDWSEIRKHRKGDRYPEHTRAIPADADFCSQVPIHAHLAWGRVLEVCE